MQDWGKKYRYLPYSCYHSLQISGRNLASKHQKLQTNTRPWHKTGPPVAGEASCYFRSFTDDTGAHYGVHYCVSTSIVISWDNTNIFQLYPVLMPTLQDVNITCSFISLVFIITKLPEAWMMLLWPRNKSMYLILLHFLLNIVSMLSLNINTLLSSEQTCHPYWHNLTDTTSQKQPHWHNLTDTTSLTQPHWRNLTDTTSLT